MIVPRKSVTKTASIKLLYKVFNHSLFVMAELAWLSVSAASVAELDELVVSLFECARSSRALDTDLLAITLLIHATYFIKDSLRVYWNFICKPAQQRLCNLTQRKVPAILFPVEFRYREKNKAKPTLN